MEDEAAVLGRPGLELAVEEGDAFPQPDKPVAAAAGRG